MEKTYLLAALVSTILVSSCMSEQGTTHHKGENRLASFAAEIDTMRITMPMVGSYGTFFMQDTVITFVDGQSFKFYDFSLDGQLLDTYFRRGNASDEVPALMDVFPILGDDDGRILVEDNDMTMSMVQDKTITQLGRPDFGWDGGKHNDYKKPNIYSPQEFSDFGVHCHLDADSLIVVPISILRRMLKNGRSITKNRYSDA